MFYKDLCERYGPGLAMAGTCLPFSVMFAAHAFELASLETAQEIGIYGAVATYATFLAKDASRKTALRCKIGPARGSRFIQRTQAICYALTFAMGVRVAFVNAAEPPAPKAPPAHTLGMNGQKSGLPGLAKKPAMP